MIPDKVDLGWIARGLEALGDGVRSLRTDMDILIRINIRLETSVSALREDMHALWSSQGDLRRRIEALEGR